MIGTTDRTIGRKTYRFVRIHFVDVPFEFTNRPIEFTFDYLIVDLLIGRFDGQRYTMIRETDVHVYCWLLEKNNNAITVYTIFRTVRAGEPCTFGDMRFPRDSLGAQCAHRRRETGIRENANSSNYSLWHIREKREN